jgi:transcription-repair coupling factor (superfamily II helicase)
VGFDLYAQLLEEAVRELKGEPAVEELDPDVQLPLPAFIPDPYMPDVHQRLYFYKRFAQAGSDEEIDDVRAEIVDRFGDTPAEVDALCELMRVKARLRGLRIRGLEAGPGRLVLTLGDGAALDPFQLAKQVTASAGAMRLTPDMKLVVHLGEDGRPAAPDGARKTRAARVQAAVKAAAGAAQPASPALEEAKARELLGAVRAVLGDLERIAAGGP